MKLKFLHLYTTNLSVSGTYDSLIVIVPSISIAIAITAAIASSNKTE